jgi:hypothetical protein
MRGRPASPTHCRNGHPWIDYRLNAQQQKVCRICERARRKGGHTRLASLHTGHIVKHSAADREVQP